MRRRAIWLAVIIISALIIVASLWNIDWVMWNKRSYWYYPWPGYWNRPVEKHELGSYVNIQYYQIVVAYVLGTFSAYRLGRGRRRNADNA